MYKKIIYFIFQSQKVSYIDHWKIRSVLKAYHTFVIQTVKLGSCVAFTDWILSPMNSNSAVHGESLDDNVVRSIRQWRQSSLCDNFGIFGVLKSSLGLKIMKIIDWSQRKMARNYVHGQRHFLRSHWYCLWWSGVNVYWIQARSFEWMCQPWNWKRTAK